MPSTLDWLRGRGDPQLSELLIARPDLTVPAPSDLSVLARRLDSPPSVWRAMEGLDAFSIQILQAVCVLHRRAHPVGSADVADLLGTGEPGPALTDRMARLETLGLIRGGAQAHPAPAVGSAFGEFPGGLGPSSPLPRPELARALAQLEPDGRGLLERLADGQPRGAVPPTGPTAELVGRLVAAGLLLRPDRGSVLLPWQVCAELRDGHPLGPVLLSAPPPEGAPHGVSTVDGTAGGQALAAVLLSRQLLDLLGDLPVPALKSGGLGVRELRRLTKLTGADEGLLALHLELLAAAGLIDAPEPRGRAAMTAWTPTGAADPFTEQTDEQCWAELAAAWLNLRRDPGRAGERDGADKPAAVLSVELSWIRGPADRRFALGALADLPPGSGTDLAGLERRLSWLAPLRMHNLRAGSTARIVEQATALGVIAFGALSTAGRELLADDGIEAAVAALVRALPAPVASILVQADLTVIAPGRLTRELAARMTQVADVESAGSATVYRVTPDSVRRGYDAGLTPTEIHQLFAAHSATPIPQALTYLIDDVARRHGVLRVGVASSYLRSDDPALIDAAVAQAKATGLVVRRIAPTVAISAAKMPDLLTALRSAGLVPAAEDGRGAVVTLTAKAHRVKDTVLPVGYRREPPPPSAEQLAALVQRMRAADQASADGEADELSPARTTALLRDAAARHAALWISYVDSQGAITQRIVEPVAVSGGAMAAFDRLRQSVRTFALHRILAVNPDPEGIDPDSADAAGSALVEPDPSTRSGG